MDYKKEWCIMSKKMSAAEEALQTLKANWNKCQKMLDNETVSKEQIGWYFYLTVEDVLRRYYQKQADKQHSTEDWIKDE